MLMLVCEMQNANFFILKKCQQKNYDFACFPDIYHLILLTPLVLIDTYMRHTFKCTRHAVDS